MLIVSDFHDYYDVMMKHGVDKTIVYQRKMEEIKFYKEDAKFKASDFPFIEEIHHKARMYWPWDKDPGAEYNASWVVIGVCGRMYAAIELKKSIFNRNEKLPDRFVAYSLASLVSFVRQCFSKRTQERFFNLT